MPPIIYTDGQRITCGNYYIVASTEIHNTDIMSIAWPRTCHAARPVCIGLRAIMNHGSVPTRTGWQRLFPRHR